VVVIGSVKVHELRRLDVLVEVFFAVGFQTLRFFFHFLREREDSRERERERERSVFFAFVCVRESGAVWRRICWVGNGERIETTLKIKIKKRTLSFLSYCK
jgi:hypothetical protein